LLKGVPQGKIRDWLFALPGRVVPGWFLLVLIVILKMLNLEVDQGGRK